jgi:hypothetical protein
MLTAFVFSPHKYPADVFFQLLLGLCILSLLAMALL